MSLCSRGSTDVSAQSVDTRKVVLAMRTSLYQALRSRAGRPATTGEQVLSPETWEIERKLRMKYDHYLVIPPESVVHWHFHVAYRLHVVHVWHILLHISLHASLVMTAIDST